MKKITALFLTLVIAFAALAGCGGPSLNSGERDILYKGVVYKRNDDMCYNMKFYEVGAYCVGEYIETYAYGQELPWSVYVLNSDENVLHSSHATWVKPGYTLPGDFGEEFASAEYVISEGIDFNFMPDDYTETATLLATFDKSVKLEDIVEREPSEISGYTLHDRIRLYYAHHANVAAIYAICSLDGKYYLDVRIEDGSDRWHEIKAEYVALLTSPIANAEKK